MGLTLTLLGSLCLLCTARLYTLLAPLFPSVFSSDQVQRLLTTKDTTGRPAAAKCQSHDDNIRQLANRFGSDGRMHGGIPHAETSKHAMAVV